MSEKAPLLAEASQIGVSSIQGRRVADLRNGGQLGVGYNAERIDAATPLAFTPTVIVVLQTPTMYGPNSPMSDNIKSILETHARSITGIDFGYTVDAEEGMTFHDGQPFQIPGKTKRTPVTPTFEIPEAYGNLIWETFRTWAWDINHPDTNSSMNYRADIAAATNNAFLMTSYAASMMAIQFDQTTLPENIIAAALYTNMWPTDPGGMLGLERNIGVTRPMVRTVTMTGIVQHGDAIHALAIEVAKKIKLAQATYGLNTNVNRQIDPSIDTDRVAASGIGKEAQASIV